MTASAHALRDEAALCWLASRGTELPDDPTEAQRLFAEAYREVGPQSGRPHQETGRNER